MLCRTDLICVVKSHQYLSNVQYCYRRYHMNRHVESEKAKERLAQAEGQRERDRLNQLFARKNIETAKTLWGVGLYFQRKGDLLEARDNLLEAFDLAIAIEGRESQEGATQNYLSQDIEDACQLVIDLVRKEKKRGNMPQDA